jgi:hypothetical protein
MRGYVIVGHSPPLSCLNKPKLASEPAAQCSIAEGDR